MARIEPTVTAAGLRLVECDFSDLTGDTDLLSRTHHGDVDLILIHGWYDPAALAAIVSKLESRDDHDVFRMEIPPARAGVVLGNALDLTTPDLDQYFAEAPRFSRFCRDLFAEHGDYEARVEDLLTRLAGGRPTSLMTHGDGRRYASATVRCLAPGGHIRLHCEDQKLAEPQKRRIHEIAQPRISSFYLMMSPPASGGELVLYDLTWDQIDDSHLSRNRCDPAKIVGRYNGLAYRMASGDVALFGNGRVHEVRPVGAGPNRWTIGGFFVFSRDGREVYYFN
jgi:hypothetical protein